MTDFVESREWYLAAYCPEGVPTTDHLKLRTVSLSLHSDSIPDNHLVVETLLLSVDPYLRGRITGSLGGLFISQYQLNQAITVFAVVRLAKIRGCRVIGSTGSDDKVKLIKEEFGYDDGFNYNIETDYDAALTSRNSYIYLFLYSLLFRYC
ncbi:unnamed protein product [Vicia faba]|uniref:Uncharacterized protein n=1 Tax=Vicia faba TaxID=3906 RepID=A0AAV0Z7S9_VICFA|nr:unnamed protein product [Vicia faba]